MARRSAVMKLPLATRCALDQRLRGGAYGDLAALVEWLHQEGHEVSKSALHRYATALRQVDAEGGDQAARVQQVSRENGGAARGVRDGLLLELGRLRYREHELLSQLAALDSGTAA